MTEVDAASPAGPPRPPDAEAEQALAAPAPAAGGEPAAPPSRRRTEPKRSRKGTRQFLEWLLLIAAALGIALLIKAFLFQAFYIPSESMVPTLLRNDRVLVNKLSYRLHDVHRGDIVVFEAPEGQEQDDVKDLVKRVIGLPGEQIEARDGRVYIDGEPLEEDYLPPGTVSENLPLTTVPADAVFVMGDNRSQSRDSRVFGPIPTDDIVGRVFVRIWPPSRISLM
ncbi:MAG: signal peptidase I [Acidimicrobiia bacterium]|nr:MAG: signal peptidase I [Acidimicrobiia bacterium]